MVVAAVAVFQVVVVVAAHPEGVVSQEEVPEVDSELQGEALLGVEVDSVEVEASEEGIVAVVVVALVDEVEDEVEVSEDHNLCCQT